MISYKCPKCGHIEFYNGKGEKPENCTRKTGFTKGRYRTCGGRLQQEGYIEDIKVSNMVVTI